MQVIVHRTQSDRTANGIRSGGERNLIGWRTESDRVADGIRSGGGRNPIGWRTRTVEKTEGLCGKSRETISFRRNNYELIITNSSGCYL